MEKRTLPPILKMYFTRLSLPASTRNYFEDNWYLGQTEPSTLDASARRKSEGYDAVLHEDPTGFIPLLRLTKPRKVCGAEMRVVDPEAMKAFFERL